MKKIAKRVTVILFVFMLALTALSRTIYYVITPQITVAEPSSRPLKKDFTLELTFDYPNARIEYMHLQLPAPLFIDTILAVPGTSYAQGDVFATVNLAYFHAAADAYRKAIADAEDDLDVFDLGQLEQQTQLSTQHTQALNAFNAQRRALADSLQSARGTLSRLQTGAADRAFAREIAQMETQIADMTLALAQEQRLYENGLVTLASIKAQQKALDNLRDDLAFKRSQHADEQTENTITAQKEIASLEQQLAELDASSSATTGNAQRAADAQNRRKLVDARDDAVAAYQAFTSLIDDEGNLRFTRNCTVASVHLAKGDSLDGHMKLYEYVEEYTPSFRAEVSKELFNALAVFSRFECKVGNELVTLTISSKDNANNQFALLLSPAAPMHPYSLDILRASGSVSSPVTVETQYYETVVPRAAVQGIGNDSANGTVYVLSTRASYFGDEQYVQAYDVRIVDSNEAYVAIEPVQRLPMGSVVAVKQSAPLADGTAVVVRDNIK